MISLSNYIGTVFACLRCLWYNLAITYLLKITLLYTFCLTNAQQVLFMMLYNYFEGSKRSKLDIRMLFHWCLPKQCCFCVTFIVPRSYNILPRKSSRYCVLCAACYAGHCRQQQPTGCQIAIKIIHFPNLKKSSKQDCV